MKPEANVDFFPDQAVIIPATLFDRKSAWKRHTNRMSWFIKDKHRERSNQVIEDPVLRITEIRVAFARVIPRETPIGKHFAESVEYFQVPDTSSHVAKCPAAVHN